MGQLKIRLLEGQVFFFADERSTSGSLATQYVVTTNFLRKQVAVASRDPAAVPSRGSSIRGQKSLARSTARRRLRGQIPRRIGEQTAETGSADKINSAPAVATRKTCPHEQIHKMHAFSMLRQADNIMAAAVSFIQSLKRGVQLRPGIFLANCNIWPC